MSRTKPNVPPYRPPTPGAAGLPVATHPEDEIEELPAVRPGLTADPTPSRLALEPAEPAEPELPLPAPEMHERLRTATATALAALPDPTGKDEIVKWAARIEVLQAYRFDGVLHKAPQWIDRNWLSWADGSPEEKGYRAPGPALNVTRKDGSHVGMCYNGDYVCRQNTTVDDPDEPGGLRMLPDHLAVVPAAEFERLFRPVKTTSEVGVTTKPQAA